MKLSFCPVCGHTPVVTSQSLDKGNGRGYPGNNTYQIQCSNNNCPLSREVPMFSTDDIYRTKEEAYNHLYKKWNEESAKINELILHRSD